LTGGIVLLFVDNWFKQSTIESDDQISTRNAFWIGMYQVLAVIFPGLSRSAATIIGGMQQKLNRSLAAEFSFFLAIPTMTAATAKSLLDIIKEQPQLLNEGGKKMLLMGTAIAFFVALIAIKGFIGYVKLKGFKVFGYYRIILGVSLLTLIALGRL
jgi:undecaprenyl-diphosphatase